VIKTVLDLEMRIQTRCDSEGVWKYVFLSWSRWRNQDLAAVTVILYNASALIYWQMLRC